MLPAAIKYDVMDDKCVFQGMIGYDGKENLFIIMGYDKNVGGVTDVEGVCLYSFLEIFPNDEAEYNSAIKCENGRYMLISYSAMKDSTSIIGIEKDNVTNLLCFDGNFLNSNAICDKYGNITFLQQGTNVLNWNICSGDIHTYISGSFGDDTDILALVRKERGNIVEISDDVDGLSIIEYSSNQKDKDVTITIEALSAVDESFRSGIRLYEKTHPNVNICLKELGELDKNQKKAQVFSTISSQDAPDLIYMERADMIYYAEKDCLLDISEIINDDTKDHMFPGIKNGGMWNNGWYLMPSDVNVSVVYVNKECYQNGQWNIEGIFDAIKMREEEGNPFEDIWLLYENHAAPEEILSLFIGDIVNSEFVDYEKRDCNFESELFGEILELCKKYGKEENHRMAISKEERIEKLLQQKILCFSEPILNFENYSELGALLDEKIDIRGLPTDGTSNYQFSSIKGIAVNKYSQQNDVIADFLDCMFNQQYYSTNPVTQIPMRKDCLENKILLQADWTDQAVVKISKRKSMRVNRKPDGGSFEKEYIEFLNQCVPYDDKNDIIIAIILEEVGPYFQGDKDRMEVQKIIQARVKLYLDENVW